MTRLYLIGLPLAFLASLSHASDGGTGDDKTPKGTLDVTGRYCIWTSNLGSKLLDAFMVTVRANSCQSN